MDMKSPILCAAILASSAAFGTSANSQTLPLDNGFFAALIKVKSHKQAAAVAKRFGFVQETDPERDNFYQNRKADATLQLLRNRIPSLYVSYRHDTYKTACGIAQDLADANLKAAQTYSDSPYWPNQKKLVSGHKATVNGNEVFFGCEQFGPKGDSATTTHVKLIR